MRLKAEADKAVLMERVAALKRKHLLEAQEERLRREKEQLNLETEFAATNARLHVLKKKYITVWFKTFRRHEFIF